MEQCPMYFLPLLDNVGMSNILRS